MLLVLYFVYFSQTTLRLSSPGTHALRCGPVVQGELQLALLQIIRQQKTSLIHLIIHFFTQAKSAFKPYTDLTAQPAQSIDMQLFL